MKDIGAENKRLESGKKVLLFATFFVFVIAMIFVSVYISTDVNGNRIYFDNYNKVLENELSIQLDKQMKMDDKIKDISANGKYTIDEPCVINNPYGISPLSSLIIFDTTTEEEVTLSINGVEVTKMEPTTKHIIPVYGLFSNAKNIVKLTMGEKEKEIEIATEGYNNDLKGYNLAQNIGDAKTIFVIGDLYRKQYLRGFDYNNNLMFYLDFDYLSSFEMKRERFLVGYSSVSTYDNSLKDLKLEMDFLGRIYSIDTNSTELIRYPNLVVSDDLKYIVATDNMYNEITKNYILNNFVDYKENSKSNAIESKEISEELLNAKIYPKKYKIAANGDYLTFDFEKIKLDTELLVVNKSDSFVYRYSIANTNVIKINNIKQAALYLYENGIYYNLLTTYEN